VTGRGFEPADMDEIAGLVHEALQAETASKRMREIRHGVRDLCQRHPLHLDRFEAGGTLEGPLEGE
jgi:glycine/serine hydroxymethyltransferase